MNMFFIDSRFRGNDSVVNLIEYILRNTQICNSLIGGTGMTFKTFVNSVYSAV